jgi:pimeloyl-ACP methyl ester carboxylesterase
VKLYYEEAGSGTPILFGHEFAGDYRNWEPQMRFFSRRNRVITYSARGYQPSDIPADVKSYSYVHWVNDAVAILDHRKIAKTHFVGLSMGRNEPAACRKHRAPTRSRKPEHSRCGRISGSPSCREHICAACE